MKYIENSLYVASADLFFIQESEAEKEKNLKNGKS